MTSVVEKTSGAMERARIALDGLSVGDAFGQRFFGVSVTALQLAVAERTAPEGEWVYTDDTVMALSLCEVLGQHGTIDQEALAAAFARRYIAEPARGYGGGAHQILSQLARGASWRGASSSVFAGQGSIGNGGAMRVAPLGAWFADDIPRLIEEARRSAEVTHWNDEGKAGAIAVALACAFAWRKRGRTEEEVGKEFLDFVLTHTPDSQTRQGVVKATTLPSGCSNLLAASALGNGTRVTAPDTVPYALWCAARHFDDYPSALWTAVSTGGDLDTLCAIVGGVVALSAVEQGVPAQWLQRRERLPFRERLGAE